MLSSGSSPLAVGLRANMWGFLLFAGAAWLVIGWTMLRLEPTNVAAVAGPVVMFGAVCELVRALAGTPTWWLNAESTSSSRVRRSRCAHFREGLPGQQH